MTTLREELESIYAEYGKLNAEVVMAVARDPEHVLHDRVFDKNKDEASEEYYLGRARALIRSVRIRYRKPEGDEASSMGTVRAFHAVKREDGERSYEPIQAIAQDPFLSRLLIAEMEREWKLLRQRYGNMEEFINLVRRDLEAASA